MTNTFSTYCSWYENLVYKRCILGKVRLLQRVVNCTHIDIIIIIFYSYYFQLYSCNGCEDKWQKFTVSHLTRDILDWEAGLLLGPVWLSLSWLVHFSPDCWRHPIRDLMHASRKSGIIGTKRFATYVCSYYIMQTVQEHSIKYLKSCHFITVLHV